MELRTPHGYSQVLGTFGEPKAEGFQNRNIVSQTVPFQMRYRDDPKHPWATVTRVRVHRKIAPIVVKVFTEIWQFARDAVKVAHGYELTTEEYDELTHKWLADRHLDEYGGAYEFRNIRGSDKVSMHSFGIALDIAPEIYTLGSAKKLPEWYSGIWEKNGFFCGENFENRKDPMHVQFAVGC